MSVNKYIIETISFLIPSILDDYYGSKSISISMIVGATCAIIANGLKKHLQKKTTTKIKESLTSTAIDAAKTLGFVKKNEIYQEELNCILPSLQIFIGLNILNIYFFATFKLNIATLLSVASIIFQYNIYTTLRKNELENYENIFNQLNVILNNIKDEIKVKLEEKIKKN